MAKRRKPLKIDDLVHEQSGTVLPIYLSVHGNKFQATLPNGKDIYHDKRDELDKEITQWLEQNTVLEWLPVIQVDEYPQNSYDPQSVLGFDMTRMWYAKKKSGTGMMYKHWEPDESGSWPSWDAKWGIEAKDFNPPCAWNGRSSKDFYLPYSEETWEELQKLQGALVDLKKVMRHLLGSGEGLLRLRNNLLGAILPIIDEIPEPESKFEI